MSSPTVGDGSPGTDSGLHETPLNDSTASSSSQVPPEVYELIQKQEDQLKLLQEQISMLLANQKPTVPVATSARDMATQSSKTNTPVKKKNTCSIAINTSVWQQQDEQQLTEECSANLPVMCSPDRQESAEVMATSCRQDTISLSELQLTQLHERTQESMVSEMMVDMPAYTSLSPQK